MRTLPLIVFGTTSYSTTPVIPTSDEATIVSGGAGGASFAYIFIVTYVMGIVMIAAMTGDHHFSSKSGATIPMAPSTSRTVAGTSMNAPGDASSASISSMPIMTKANPSSKPPTAMVEPTRFEDIYGFVRE